MNTSPGDRFGRLTAVASVNGERWLYRCDCGADFQGHRRNVQKGATRSCGCLRREVTAARATHGHTSGGKTSPTLKAWSHAKGRCFNPADKSFPDYGARGITMSPMWASDFSAFLSDMGECPQGLTLDRIDSNGNYEPGNCRWAGRKVQSRNRRNVHAVELDGEAMTMPEAVERSGAEYQAVYRLVVRKGMPFAEALRFLSAHPTKRYARRQA